jgi:hypothetical protein
VTKIGASSPSTILGIVGALPQRISGRRSDDIAPTRELDSSALQSAHPGALRLEYNCPPQSHDHLRWHRDERRMPSSRLNITQVVLLARPVALAAVPVACRVARTIRALDDGVNGKIDDADGRAHEKLGPHPRSVCQF